MEYQELQLSDKCRHLMAYRSDHKRLAANSIRQIGICRAQDNYLVSRRKPSFHMVIYTFSGQGSISLDNQEAYNLQPETLITIPSGLANKIALQSEHWDFCWLMLEDCTQWSKLNSAINFASITPHQGAFFKNCLEGVVLDCNVKDSSFEQLADIQLTALVKLLNNSVFPSEPEKVINSHTLRRLQHGFDYIGQRLHRHWKVCDLAELVHCSPAHLHKLCKKHFNRGPMKILTQLRMEKARRLLIDSDYSVTDISGIVGYAESGNFASRYKKYWHESPRQSRKTPRVKSTKKPSPPPITSKRGEKYS